MHVLGGGKGVAVVGVHERGAVLGHIGICNLGLPPRGAAKGTARMAVEKAALIFMRVDSW